MKPMLWGQKVPHVVRHTIRTLTDGYVQHGAEPIDRLSTR